MRLGELIVVAASKKPAMGSECNHCGWCCMTEVCHVGVARTGSKQIPCSLLVEVGGVHLCSVADEPNVKEQMSMGEGCDAMTQDEAIANLRSKGAIR